MSDEYDHAEPIAPTKENFKKVLRLTYKRLLYPPLLLTILLGFFALPLSVFVIMAKMDLVISVMLSACICIIFSGLGPYLQIKLAFHNAKQNPQHTLGKQGY